MKKRQFKVTTTQSNHNYEIAPNRLKQDFYATKPNEVYVGDITYISTKEGWVYLATVIDLYARTVVGWNMEDKLYTPLVSKALWQTRNKRSTLNDAIFHSDRGVQYASDHYKQLLDQFGMLQSMSAKGNSYDNAVAESFFHSLKTEVVYRTTFESKKEAIKVITDYIHFYNRKRLHSYNGYKSPMEMEFLWFKVYLEETC
jgi:transposase InsO family protein